MESGAFETAAGSWVWSVRGLTGPPGEDVVAKCFCCDTTLGPRTFSMLRELGVDFGPIDDESARKLLAHADTCLIRGERGTLVARINRVAEHRPLPESSLDDVPHRHRRGRLRISVRGRRARHVPVVKPLGHHTPGELLAIVGDAS